MNDALRPRLAVALIGLVWAVVFTRPEVELGPAVRGMTIAAALVVTGVVVYVIRRRGDTAFLGPLVVFSNLALVTVLVVGLASRVTAGGLVLMLLVMVQMVLFFLLSITYKRFYDADQARSSDMLNEKTQQLLYLQQVGIAMNSAEEVQSFLDIVLRATSHITKAERVVLMLKSRQGGLSFEAGYGVDDLQAPVVDLLRHDVVGEAFEQAASVLSPPPAADHFDLLDVEPERLVSVPLVAGCTCMMMPLVRKDGCWGILYAERMPAGDGDVFSLLDLEVFRVLASQISVALENADLYFQMRETYRSTIEALAAAIEAKDSYTHGHSSAVTRYAVPVARELGMTEAELQSVEFAAILHDIGKIAVPESVLNKPGKLTREEFEDIKRHPAIGAEIIRSVGFLGSAVAFIRHHHERWDGKGYPDGLQGDAIPLGAQVVGIVDTFDAMTSTRSYRQALPEDTAIKEIQRCSGTQFNPTVVKAFMRAYDAGRIRPDDTSTAFGFTETSSFRTEGVGG